MNRLGIIVPYRRRHMHLKLFLQRMVDYCTLEGLDFKIIVVEQDLASAFNRGMLCNIGFKEAMLRKCNYVVFHDVDMIPLQVDYSYADHPVHLASDDIPFDSYFGGMTLFPAQDFKKINGFSNFYWGWGFEDDDLRYRCIKNGLQFEHEPETPVESDKVLPIFNGYDAYAAVDNVINFSRDFTIEIKVQIDRFSFDHEQPSDVFPIMSIKGNDFVLSYSSFNRFYLQFFDKDGNYHDIFSDIVVDSTNDIKITHNKSSNTVSMHLNDKAQGRVKLPTSIYSYSSGRKILIGTNTDFSKYYKGTVDEFKICNGRRTVVHYVDDTGDPYKLEDKSGMGNDGELVNVYFDKFTPPINYNGYIPYRRKSKIHYLKHESNGFVWGRWKDDLTRWNQLRYNNEVLAGSYEDIEDGLSTCQYTLHSKYSTKNTVHLKVGI